MSAAYTYPLYARCEICRRAYLLESPPQRCPKCRTYSLRWWGTMPRRFRSRPGAGRVD